MSSGGRVAASPHRTGVLTTNAGGDVVLRRVLVRSLDEPGVEAILEVGTLIVGSHDDADLRLSDRSVSRYHLELSLLGDGVRARDLGSTNGSFVGGLRLESLVLTPPAELVLGKARVALSAVDAVVEGAPPEWTSWGDLVGGSAVMRRVYELLEWSVDGASPVIFEGPQGSGKTAAARALHRRRFGSQVPPTIVDLGAPSAEAALHDLGTELASGTLLLERVDECSAPAATALLGLLEARERGEVGFAVCGTCVSDLRRRVEAGALPRALYFHLAGVRIVLPPLAQRPEDLAPLTRALAARCGVPDFVPERSWLDELRTRAWPGNVRELARAVELLLARSRPPSMPPPPPTAYAGGADRPFKQAKRDVVQEFERRYVADLLRRHDGNLSRAAEEAGLDRGHLARLARRHGLR